VNEEKYYDFASKISFFEFIQSEFNSAETHRPTGSLCLIPSGFGHITGGYTLGLTPRPSGYCFLRSQCLKHFNGRYSYWYGKRLGL